MDSQDKDVKLFKKKDFNNGKRPVQEDRARWKNPNLLSSLDFIVCNALAFSSNSII